MIQSWLQKKLNRGEIGVNTFNKIKYEERQ